MSSQKNYTLELLKLFASYMVVFIHIQFYGKIGTAVDTLARFAVPLFFLVSGYYAYKVDAKTIKRRIKNVLTLFVFAAVCYILFKTTRMLLDGNIDGVVTYFASYLNVKILIKLFVFNVPLSSVHLWFLLALLYVYLVFYFVKVFSFNEKAVHFISLSLLVLHILLGEGLSLLGIKVPVFILRNFAMVGIPFFAAGIFAKKNEEKLRNIPNYLLVIIAAIGCLTSLLSRYLLGKNELYAGSLLVLFSIVAVFVKYQTAKYPAFLNALSGCSTYIYIFHIMVSSAFIMIYKLFGIDLNTSVILRCAHPVIVCVASTLLAYVVVRLSKVISSKKQSKA